MGCSNCGNKNGGKPAGCKSNGGCSTGGCNRLNVHDWLANLPFADPESRCSIVEISFNQGSRKDYFRNTSLQPLIKGDMVTVEGVAGYDVGEVSLTGELVRLQLKKHRLREDSPDIKRILRRASQLDLEKWRESKAREKDLLVRSRAIARQHGLQMKMAEVELQADGKKATFYYTADDRVDFRELIKTYHAEFRVKVEMKQIGSRQEAGKVGGIGSCGRELCCSTWLTDFKSVNTQAARYQNLSINQTKLSGQCGRLKCCLNYELDTYLDALQHFPTNADTLEISRGRAFLAKKDIFRNLMWYTMPDSSRQYPLTIERVLEIKRMNEQGLRPDELQPVELVGLKTTAENEPEFVDVVGQLSLRNLEKTSRRNKQKEKQKPKDKRGSSEPGKAKISQEASAQGKTGGAKMPAPIQPVTPTGSHRKNQPEKRSVPPATSTASGNVQPAARRHKGKHQSPRKESPSKPSDNGAPS